jgi:predicted nucleic acid-binding protein
MSAVFADTWFFLAILNRLDPGHARAVQLNRDEQRHRVTTDWVLVEVGDALARTGNRDVFANFFDWIRNHSGTTIVPATRSLLDDGVLF